MSTQQRNMQTQKQFMLSLLEKAKGLIAKRKRDLMDLMMLHCNTGHIEHMKRYIVTLQTKMKETKEETMTKIDAIRKDLAEFPIDHGSGMMIVLKDNISEQIKQAEVLGLKEEYKLVKALKNRIDEVTRMMKQRAQDFVESQNIQQQPQKWLVNTSIEEKNNYLGEYTQAGETEPERKAFDKKEYQVLVGATFEALEQKYKNIEGMKVKDDMRLLKFQATLEGLTQSYETIAIANEEKLSKFKKERKILLAQRDAANVKLRKGHKEINSRMGKDTAKLTSIKEKRSKSTSGTADTDIKHSLESIKESYDRLIKLWTKRENQADAKVLIEIDRLNEHIKEESKTKKLLDHLTERTFKLQKVFETKQAADSLFDSQFSDLLVALQTEDELNQQNVQKFVREIQSMERLTLYTDGVIEQQLGVFQKLMNKQPGVSLRDALKDTELDQVMGKYEKFLQSYNRFGGHFSFYS